MKSFLGIDPRLELPDRALAGPIRPLMRSFSGNNVA